MNSETAYRCWAEIDQSALRHNARLVRERIGPRVELLAVVKANGYGHGMVGVAKALAQDVDSLASRTWKKRCVWATRSRSQSLFLDRLWKRRGRQSLPEDISLDFHLQEAEQFNRWPRIHRSRSIS